MVARCGPGTYVHRYHRRHGARGIHPDAKQEECVMGARGHDDGATPIYKDKIRHI